MEKNLNHNVEVDWSRTNIDDIFQYFHYIQNVESFLLVNYYVVFGVSTEVE